MYRKSKNHRLSENINLDSLMDILTCAFGVMLFLVIFAVIEARGVNIKMVTPMAQEPPQDSERLIFLCDNGRIRYLGFDQSVIELIEILGKKQITFDNVPMLIKEANEKNITDGYFSYSLNHFEWSTIFERRRIISVIIKERADISGETVDQLKKGPSQYATLLQQFDKNKAWIAFMVDDKSMEVFREARSIAIKDGFSVGWDPGSITFPYEEVILGGGNRASGKGVPCVLCSPQNRIGG